MKRIVPLTLSVMLLMVSCMLINISPKEPYEPHPEDGAKDVPVDVTLSWKCEDPDGDALHYDVYLAKSEDELSTPVKENSAETEYKPGVLEGHTTYYWKVIARDSRGKETEGPVWSFTTQNRPPRKPYNPSPADESAGVSTSVTLEWKCSDPDGDTLTYDVYFGDTPLPPLVLEDLSTNTLDIGEIGPLQEGKTYYWRIVAKDPYGEETIGDVWSFTTVGAQPSQNHPPSEPTAIYPEDGDDNVPVNVTLRWSASDPDGDELSYDVYFGTRENPPIVAVDLNVNSYNPGTLEGHTTYYWKVVAKDPKGGKRSSDVWFFTTQNRPPSTPTLIYPGNGATDISLTPILTWRCSDPDGDALTYDLYASTNIAYVINEKTSALMAEDLPTDYFEIETPLEPEKEYYWKVVAKDGHGGETRSEIWNFTTEGE